MASSSDIHPIDRHIGRQVRQLRRSKGLTQKALAERLDMSFQQIQKYETGANRISGSVLVRTAHALGVPIATLFDGLPEVQGPRAGKTSPAPSRVVLASVEREDLLANLERLPRKTRQRLITLVRALANLKVTDRVRLRPHDHDAQTSAIEG